MQSPGIAEAATLLFTGASFFLLPLGLLIWLVVKVNRIERLLEDRESKERRE